MKQAQGQIEVIEYNVSNGADMHLIPGNYECAAAVYPFSSSLKQSQDYLSVSYPH